MTSSSLAGEGLPGEGQPEVECLLGAEAVASVEVERPPLAE